MNKFVLRQSLLLLLTATIWGVAFVAQSVGMDYVGPFTFNVMRSIIGGVVLLPFIFPKRAMHGSSSLGSCIHLSEKQDLSQQCTLWLFRYLGFFLEKK